MVPSALVSLAASSGLGDVDAVKVVGAEGTVALGALPLPGVVAHLQTLVAEHVETLGEHRLLVSHVAARAAQLGLRDGERKAHCMSATERPRQRRYYLHPLCGTAADARGRDSKDSSRPPAVKAPA